MPTDLRIEQSVIKLPILEIAAKLRITEADVLPYGRSIAKIPLDVLKSKPSGGRGKLVLVTAMTPTPSGLGKTTMTIGLGDDFGLDDTRRPDYANGVRPFAFAEAEVNVRWRRHRAGRITFEFLAQAAGTHVDL